MEIPIDSINSSRYVFCSIYDYTVITMLFNCAYLSKI